MDIGTQRNAFRAWKSAHFGTLTSQQNSLYHELLDTAYETSSEVFDLANDSIKMFAGYKMTQAGTTRLQEDRQRLIDVGLITVKAGKRNTKSPIYTLIDLTKSVNEPVIKTVNEIVNETVNEPVTNKDKIDKIDKLSKDNNIVGQADNGVTKMFSDKPEPEKKAKPTKTKSTLTKQEQADFEELWKAYPRKSGKDKAAVDYAKAVRTGVSNQQIATAIAAYKQEIKALGTDPQYVKMGSTWFHQKGWESEYITAVPKKTANRMPYNRHQIVEPQITTHDVISDNNDINDDALPEFMRGYFSEVKTGE